MFSAEPCISFVCNCNSHMQHSHGRLYEPALLAAICCPPTCLTYFDVTVLDFYFEVSALTDVLVSDSNIFWYCYPKVSIIVIRSHMQLVLVVDYYQIVEGFLVHAFGVW